MDPWMTRSILARKVPSQILRAKLTAGPLLLLRAFRALENKQGVLPINAPSPASGKQTTPALYLACGDCPSCLSRSVLRHGDSVPSVCIEACRRVPTARQIAPV